MEREGKGDRRREIATCTCNTSDDLEMLKKKEQSYQQYPLESQKYAPAVQHFAEELELF